MITAKNVRYMIDIPLEHLKAIALQNKITGIVFAKAEFLGMTNGSEFCYTVTDVEGSVSKLFLRYDPTADRVTASIG
jgi:hypothetical protein